MSKDTAVLVKNSTNRVIRVHDQVTGNYYRISAGGSLAVTGNRASGDDVVIGIMDSALEGGSTVGRFRFENPDIGYSWMKSDWNQYTGQYAMRGYGKLAQPYKGYDYVVQSAKDQKITTGMLPKHQKYVFGKFDPSYNPTPSHPSKGIWAFKAPDFNEEKYLLSKGFKIIAEHETRGDMFWELNVVNLDWYQDPVV